MIRIVIFILLSSFFVHAQQLVVKTAKGTTTIPSRTSVITSLAEDSLIISKESSSEKSQWIVELATPSIVQQKLLGIKKISSSSSERTALVQRIKTTAPNVEVKKEFSVVLNGFTIAASKDEISKLRSTSGIKKIFKDIKVSSQPFTSASSTSVTITPPDGISGKGIRIGVIDTGIDYNHESLGGGFGNGFHVAGGYDFVNDDVDPMDDNGHGTHVAGIIGGNSPTIKSIAYNSSLFAYKVLDAHGSGNASNVLAAIEQAINDSVDVINLSLGSSSGNPNDVLSEAVNRAVEAGIVVVAAAGNTGEYETIHTPGVAKYALTVGATDGNTIASFSAKGPVSDQYGIKPDVVAPGVGILSAKIGGGYVAMSGTSMATPFVTSIAAALKEMHPEWNAFQIKDAIISHTNDLHTSLFAQGNGLITEKIFSTEIIPSPAHISFGFNAPQINQWTNSDTVTIYNPTTDTKKYEFQYHSTNPALSITFHPSSIELQPGEQQRVVITLSTNNLFLINNKQFSEGYTGKLFGYSTADTLTIPFTFFKGNILHLEFSEAPWQVLLHNQRNFSTIATPKTNTASFVVNNGTYDVVSSFFGSYYVVKENIPVNGFTSVQIAKEEAVHQITMSPSNEKGNPLSVEAGGTYHFVEGILYKPAGYAYVGIGGGMMNASNDQVKYFSPISSKYSFGHTVTFQYGTSKSYTYETVLDSGIAESKNITFVGNDLKKVEMKFSVESSVQKIFPITWTSFSGMASRVSATFYNEKDAPLTFPFVQTNYFSAAKSSFPFYYHREAYKY